MIKRHERDYIWKRLGFHRKKIGQDPVDCWTFEKHSTVGMLLVETLDSSKSGFAVEPDERGIGLNWTYQMK